MANKPQKKRGRPKGQSDTERESMSAMRLGQVEDALLSGRSHSWCMEFFSQPEFGQVENDDGVMVRQRTGGWGVTPRQVQNYIARVQAKWREVQASPARREEARERVLMLLRKYADAEFPGAAGAACKAADMLNKIDGCYAPVEVKHSGAVDVTSLTPAERQAKIDALLAKARAGAQRG